MSYRWSAFALLCVVLAGLSTLAAKPLDSSKLALGDWPQWRGPDRTGLSRETGLNMNWDEKAPELVWIGEGVGTGYASVSVVGDRIYTTGNTPADKPTQQSVTAINAADGKVIWSAPVSDEAPKHGYEGSRCTPTVDGDRLYVVASDGTVGAYSAEDGKVIWRRNFKNDWKGRMHSGWGFSESPLIDGDKLLCTPGGDDAMIVALNKMTGEEIWRAAVPKIGDRGGDGAGYSSIVTSEGAGVKQYVQLVGRGAIGVRADDGKFLWGYNPVANGTANIPTPIVTGDFVFCSSGYGTGSALVKLSRDGDGVKAEEVYFLDAKTMQNHHGGMLLVGDHVYCGHGHNNGFPICVDLASGKIEWGGERGPGGKSAAVTYADGCVIFRYQTGEVAVFEANPKEMKLKGVFKPTYQEGQSWAHPVVANGNLYLREQNKLMCYSLKK